MMNTYEKMNAAASCQNLTEFGDKLIDFAESVLQEKHPEKFLSLFYRLLTENNLVDFMFHGFTSKNFEPIYICEGKSAVGKLINFTIPDMGKPIETLHKLIVFGQHIKNIYTQPAGKLITKEKVNEIINYLDRNYNFSNKVFKDKKAVIGIIPYSHKEVSSHCLAQFTEREIGLHIFIYHTIADSEFDVQPEYVFFHELGHTLYVRYTGGLDIQEEMKKIFKHYFPKGLEIYSSEQQSDVIADILAMGMMHGSPYENLDPFEPIHQEDKQVFKQIFEEMIKGVKRNADYIR